MSVMHRREPILNAPTVITASLAVLAAIHLGRQFLTPALDDDVITLLGFSPARLLDGGGAPGGELVRWSQLATHALLHADLLHLGMNCAWLLAAGTLVARRIGALRFLVLAFVSAAAGAAAFTAVNGDARALVLGASGGISGLLGAATRLIHAASLTGELRTLRDHIHWLPRTTLWQALGDRNVLISCAVFIGLNLLVAFGFGADLAAGGIAWETHVGGFLFGLLSFGLFDPGPRPAGRDDPDLADVRA